MDIAFASNGSAGGGIASFIPLLILGLIPAFLFNSIAKRKGRSQWLWFFVGLFPVFGWFAGIWLASLPDKSFVEDVRALVTKLQKFDFVPRAYQSSGQSTIPETWQCSCGKMNNLDESNCPDCGLKRDYLLAKEPSTKKG